MTQTFKERTADLIRKKRAATVNSGAIARREEREKPEKVSQLIANLNRELNPFGITAYRNRWFRKIVPIIKLCIRPWKLLSIFNILTQDIILRDRVYPIDWGIYGVGEGGLITLSKSTDYGSMDSRSTTEEKMYEILSEWVSDLKTTVIRY